MKNDEVRAKREPSKLFLVSVAIFLAAGFTHSLTRDSLNLPLVNDPSVPVFPRAESTLFSGHFQRPLGPLFKRNKIFLSDPTGNRTRASRVEGHRGSHEATATSLSEGVENRL